MPADDHPVTALKKQFELEDSSASVISKQVLIVADSLPLPWPLNKAVTRIKDRLAGDSLERIRLMLEACSATLRAHAERLEQLESGLSQPALSTRIDAARELILDAARKAEATRSKERVKRIGLILANAIVEPKPPDEDEVEEMMRVAMVIGDRDIEYLSELIKIQGHALTSRSHITRHDVNRGWSGGFWGNQINTEIDSVFSKLESYGLVSRIAPPNNLNITADFQNQYALLKKGLRFVELIHEVAIR